MCIHKWLKFNNLHLLVFLFIVFKISNVKPFPGIVYIHYTYTICYVKIGSNFNGRYPPITIINFDRSWVYTLLNLLYLHLDEIVGILIGRYCTNTSS